MMTGKRPPDFGRKTSARSRAPSRMGTSRSFSTSRSWRGCELRPAALPAFGTPVFLFDLDLRFAQELAPVVGFLAHELIEFLRRARELDRHHLLGEHLLH